MTSTDDHLDRKAVLQSIVDRLTAQHAGEDPRRVRDLLEQEMAAAGLELGAEKWLEASAIEISAGRVLVVDPRQDRRPDVS